MRALSLWQPWASLVVTGEKQYETRHWETKWRGLLAIHAARNREHLWVAEQDPFTSVLMRHFKNVRNIPLGGIVGVVKIVGILPTHLVLPTITPTERDFGDYSPGRFAWKLEVVDSFPMIPYRGQQGIFDVNLSAWEKEHAFPSSNPGPAARPAEYDVSAHDMVDDNLMWCGPCETFDPTGDYPIKCTREGCPGWIHFADDAPGGQIAVKCDTCDHVWFKPLRYKRPPR